VERLGDFLELEVVLTDDQTVEQGQHVARQLIRALQIPETALVAAAYIDLLEQRPATSASPDPTEGRTS
jgi:adenylate cyclase class IV